MLLPSGSRTNAPKYVSWYSGHSRGACSTVAPSATATSKKARTAALLGAMNARCDSRKPSPVACALIQKSGRGGTP
jgi:hypothetical protein